MKIFFKNIEPKEIFNELRKKKALPIHPTSVINKDSDMGYFFWTFNQLDSQVSNVGMNEELTTLWGTPIIKWETEPAGSYDYNNALHGGAENHFVEEQIFFSNDNINGSVTWYFDQDVQNVYWRTVVGNCITISNYRDSLYNGTTIEITSNKYNHFDSVSAKQVFYIMGKLSKIIDLIYDRQ